MGVRGVMVLVGCELEGGHAPLQPNKGGTAELRLPTRFEARHFLLRAIPVVLVDHVKKRIQSHAAFADRVSFSAYEPSVFSGAKLCLL